MTYRYIRNIVFGRLLGWVVLPVHAATGNVLMLHSYHPQYTWTSELARGVREELEQRVDKESLHIEYMDTRRHQDDR